MPISGVEIRRIREQLGLTQVEFAEVLGTIGNTVAKWERDEAVPRETVVRLIQMVSTHRGLMVRTTQTRTAAKKR
jgi:DNA-binding transcriptional regulator YiaG